MPSAAPTAPSMRSRSPSIFCLAVTPINAEAAWEEFQQDGFQRAPRLLYRPLAFEVDRQKKSLFSVRLDHFEDPVLTDALSRKATGTRPAAIDARGAGNAAFHRTRPRALWLGRAGFAQGGQGYSLQHQAGPRCESASDGEDADFAFVERRARAMIKTYAADYQGFSAADRVARRPAGRADGFGRAAVDLAQYGHGARPGRGAAEPRGRRAPADLFQRLGPGAAPLPLGACRL